ncbi:MAG: hypothetical protein HGA44_15345 [Cellulomonadaceae bacterium]|nr:hypothetical protein [Cellulomonadaceae bacterium]
MRHVHRAAAVAAALTATLALTSCAGSTDEAAPMAPATATPTETDMATPMAALMPISTGDPFADVRTAAAHMPETALTLATGLAAATGTDGEVDSEAAALRSTLTALLQEHVYLAGYAVATAYVAGADSAEFTAAASALDANSVDLSDAIGSLAGEENGAAFLDQWRAHIGFFVDYALAAKTGDQAGKDAALTSLQGYTTAAGAFFEQISAGNLPAADIAMSFGMHITSLTAAIDALAAGDPTAPTALQAAAAHMGEASATIATGLDAALDLPGDPNDGASALRAGLTNLLQEHVYLAGLAVFTAYTAEGGVESEAFTQAAATLDANSVALSQAVASLSDEQHGTDFLSLWRAHIGFFVDYAVARATGDDAAADASLVDLDGYRPAAGAFFEEVSGGELPADAVAEGLGHHVETLAGAIDSLAAALVG